MIRFAIGILAAGALLQRTESGYYKPTRLETIFM